MRRTKSVSYFGHPVWTRRNKTLDTTYMTCGKTFVNYYC